MKHTSIYKSIPKPKIQGELAWLKEFERHFYKEGGWNKEDLHVLVMDRIHEVATKGGNHVS